MKFYRYNINIKLLNILCVILFIPLFFIMCILDLNSSINFSFLVIYFLWLFLHEFLHGIGFAVNKKIDRKRIVYGACLEKGILYCMCKQKIDKKCILISLLFPFMFIGIFTFFLGIIINNKLLELLSLFNIIGCIGDLVMFFNFIRLPDFLYTDLDDCTGFVLISENALEKYNLFGLDLIEFDDISNMPISKSCKKIQFSPFSSFVFIILLVLIFIVCGDVIFWKILICISMRMNYIKVELII